MLSILSRRSTVLAQPLRRYSTYPQHPKEGNFFAKDKIGVEVTPLIAFVSVAACSAAGFLIHHAYKDEDLRLRPGQIDKPDEALEKALASK